MSQSTNQIIKSYFSNECGLDLSGLNDSSSLFLSGVLDSIDVIQLIAYLEKQFNIKINAFDLSLEDLDSISKIEHLLNKLGCVEC